MLLDSEHCVFVLGMDGQAVAKSIEAKYKDLAGETGAQMETSRASVGASWRRSSRSPSSFPEPTERPSAPLSTRTSKQAKGTNPQPQTGKRWYKPRS